MATVFYYDGNYVKADPITVKSTKIPYAEDKEGEKKMAEWNTPKVLSKLNSHAWNLIFNEGN